jgi:hypothetical protein
MITSSNYLSGSGMPHHVHDALLRAMPVTHPERVRRGERAEGSLLTASFPRPPRLRLDYPTRLFSVISFADPPPPNPNGIISFQNGTARARSRSSKLFPCNTCAPPEQVLQTKTYSLAKSFRCNTYIKGGAGEYTQSPTSFDGRLPCAYF